VCDPVLIVEGPECGEGVGSPPLNVGCLGLHLGPSSSDMNDVSDVPPAPDPVPAPGQGRADRPALPRSTAFPLASWLFLTLGAAHAAAASVDVLSSGAGVFPAAVDATVAVVVPLGLVIHRWGPAPLVQRLAPAGLVLGVSLAAAASGVRGAASGRPWLAADVVLAVLAAVAIPGIRAFVLAVVAAEVAWVGSLLPGVAGAAEQESSSSWLLLALLGAFSAATAVGMWWSRAWLRAEVETAVRAAARQAVTDPLTGANNRRGLERAAIPMIEHARRSGEAVHCLFLDVDALRSVNDQVGQAGGDVVLRAVHEALLASIRATDVVARWSGDQFVVLGPGTGTSPLEMERRIRGQLADNPPVSPDVWAGSVSIGSATLVPWDEGNVDSLLTRAEEDMQLRRSLRRQGRARAASGPVPSRPGTQPPGVERGSNPPTVPPVAT
jgi:diguanylate cyclase (GGDEF)-like protein